MTERDYCPPLPPVYTPVEKVFNEKRTETSKGKSI